MATLERAEQIYQRALERKGSEALLRSMLGAPLAPTELQQWQDADWLSGMSKKIFQSGFVWRVVEQKWPNFCELFFDFVPEKMVLMSDEMLAAKAADPRIIRNANKVFTIRHNAQMILDIAKQHGRFADWIAAWPTENIIGLWLELKKQGARLGGNTGPYSLRAMGKDTFLLSRDVEAYLRAYQVIEGSSATSLGNLKRIQAQFNDWQQQSGLSLQQLSRLIAFANGDNVVGLQQGSMVDEESV